MSHPKKLAAVLAVLILALTTQISTAVQTLIPAGSVWRYNDSGVAQAGWTTVAFNDAAWPSGPAQLGYGDADETTTISYGSDPNNKRITAHFRRSFSVANPAAFSALTVRFLRDDGAVIYLNGTEVVRSNMPTGAISAATLASAAIANADETTWLEAPIPRSLLTTGTNVVAVEIHQNAVTSSDLSFDLELRATDALPPPPSVTLVSPADHAVDNSTTVTFTASATSQSGLSSATLFVGGPPVTAVFSGPSQVQDAQISADTPATANGAGTIINVDGQLPHAHGLMKFPTLIGGGPGQVPAGAVVTSATLRLNCTNPGFAMQIYRLTEDWNEDQATWNQRSTGVSWGAAGADGPASHAGVAVVGDCTTTGLRNVDVTRFVQEWAAGTPNHGIVFTDSGTDGIDFTSSEGATSPVLTVLYKSAQSAIGTESVNGVSDSAAFSASLSPGTYFWNVRFTDTDGQTSFAPGDYEITVDVGAPNLPTLVSPSNGASDVPINSTLRAVVSDPSGGTLTATATIRKAAEPEFTIVALPDTQHYSEAFPEVFTAQTQWIVDNKDARNIVFVTHEGDVVEHQGTVLEWQRANASMSLLDGVVPYGIGPGNHDLPTTNFNIYFPWTRYAGQPWYGGHYQNLNDHNFQLFSGGGKDFIIVHLAYCPSAAAVAWADSVYKTYPNRIGILTTHAYLNEAAQRSTHGCTNTQYLWDDLAVPNQNLHFMLSGHVHDEARRSDVVNGHPVYQMLADYQDRASGGEGWLRILRFVPADNKVYVQTYSPWLNRFETDANSEFTLDFPMAGAFATAGSVNVVSGGTATITPSGLQAGTTYDWRMTVANSSGGSVTGPAWRFTTAFTAPPNAPPTAGAEAYAVLGGATLNIAAPGVLANDSDPEGASLTAQLVSSVAHGTLSLAANGGFVYTPAAGYTGPDAFTYRASDGQATSAPSTVSVTVTAPPPSTPVTVFSANFNAGTDSFAYADDVFQGTVQPSYATGSRITGSGITGGALRVLLGGVNGTDIANMSGGWRRTFTLSASASVTVAFRYYLHLGNTYEADEFSQALMSVDGMLRPAAPGYVAQLSGSGDGGAVVETGWQQVTIPVGTLGAGTHTLTIGGFNSQKTETNEQTNVLVDDVVVTRQ
jgi:hypothetical protein